MIQIKETPSKETYIVLQPVFKKEKPIENCTLEGDDLEQHVILTSITIKN